MKVGRYLPNLTIFIRIFRYSYEEKCSRKMKRNSAFSTIKSLAWRHPVSRRFQVLKMRADQKVHRMLYATNGPSTLSQKQITVRISPQLMLAANLLVYRQPMALVASFIMSIWVPRHHQIIGQFGILKERMGSFHYSYRGGKDLIDQKTGIDSK